MYNSLYITDLDGTLLTGQGSISNYSTCIINKLINIGLNFTIATARSLNHTVPLVNALNLKLPIIINNGAAIFDPKEQKYIKKIFLNIDLAKNILHLIKSFKSWIYCINENKDVTFHFNSSSRIKANLYKEGERYAEIVSPSNKNINKILQNNIIAFSIIVNSKELSFLETNLKNECLNYHISKNLQHNKYYWLDITSSLAHKGLAALYIKKKMSFSRLISFGDNMNDLTLFEVSDERYAVSNACEYLIKKSTAVISSNEDNGVAKFLCRRYLNY